MTGYNPALESIVNEAVRELFVSYEVTLADPNPAAPKALAEEMIIAAIGYTADEFLGSLVIATTPTVIASMSVGSMLDTDDKQSDWVGELSNMLLGRIKTALSSRGVNLTMSIPTVIRGLALKAPAPPQTIGRWVSYDATAGTVSARFNAAVNPDYVPPDVQESNEVATEGDFMLF